MKQTKLLIFLIFFFWVPEYVDAACVSLQDVVAYYQEDWETTNEPTVELVSEVEAPQGGKIVTVKVNTFEVSGTPIWSSVYLENDPGVDPQGNMLDPFLYLNPEVAEFLGYEWDIEKGQVSYPDYVALNNSIQIINNKLEEMEAAPIVVTYYDPPTEFSNREFLTRFARDNEYPKASVATSFNTSNHDASSHVPIDFPLQLKSFLDEMIETALYLDKELAKIEASYQEGSIEKTFYKDFRDDLIAHYTAFLDNVFTSSDPALRHPFYRDWSRISRITKPVYLALRMLEFLQQVTEPEEINMFFGMNLLEVHRRNQRQLAASLSKLIISKDSKFVFEHKSYQHAYAFLAELMPDEVERERASIEKDGPWPEDSLRYKTVKTLGKKWVSNLINELLAKREGKSLAEHLGLNPETADQEDAKGKMTELVHSRRFEIEVAVGRSKLESN